MTTLGANVTLVPESVVYGETLDDYTLQVDYNIPLNYRADQVPRLGDSYPGDTAPWGYIVIETGSAVSRRSPDQGAYLAAVKYAKPKIPFDSGMAGLYETHRRFDTGRLERRMGTRVFLAADADAETLAQSSLPEWKPMAETGAWAAALLREKQIERNWRVGLARITALYDSYAPIGEIVPINKGILEADATAVMMWNKDVVPGTTRRIDEIYWEDDVRKCWVRVTGNNGWPLVRGDLRIRATLNASNLAAVKTLVGTVNSNDCPNILGAADGTLWFKTFSLRQRKRGEGLRYDCIMGLAYDPLGWDAETLAQLQKYEVREQAVLDNDGNAIEGEFQRMGSWIPDDPDAEPTKVPIPGNTASFALLDGYLA